MGSDVPQRHLGAFGIPDVAYGTLADLYKYGAPERALGGIPDATKEAELETASQIVDSYFRGRYSLPLASWDAATTEATCKIAAYNLLATRGYNPAAGADPNIRDRWVDAIEWLRRVQKQQAHPNVVSLSPNEPSATQPMVLSSSVVNVATGATASRRGW